MNSRLHKLASDIAESVDYDIWKDGYNEETSEEPHLVYQNRGEIVDLIKAELSDVFEKAEMVDALLNLQRIRILNEVGLGQEKYQYLKLELWTHYLGSNTTDNETMYGRSVLCKYLSTHAKTMGNE